MSIGVIGIAVKLLSRLKAVEREYVRSSAGNVAGASGEKFETLIMPSPAASCLQQIRGSVSLGGHGLIQKSFGNNRPVRFLYSSN
jgi:hypothetical protein